LNKMGRGGEGEGTSPAEATKIPVTLLCGFLGSGKTTLLKHILESKHEEEAFKCAVIVNDMAELNIDKSLIDNTSLIQSDEAMIGMQNGCICCTLQTDLVKQIVSLTQSKQNFNYILIEASGVSEPHEIAPLFDVHDHDEEDPDEIDHDHDDGPQLGEVARLDTCVTVIDSSEFYNNLSSMTTYDQCDVVGTIPELMMDQVEFANVIILNKRDLVNDDQAKDLDEKVALLNPQAQIVKTTHSKIDVKDILDTKLYKDKEEFWVTSTKTAEYAENERKRLEELGERVPEACTARFDIKSFIYRARKPFHPGKLVERFLNPYFMDPIENLEEDEENDSGVDEDQNGDGSESPKRQKIDDETKKLKEEERKQELIESQKEANIKYKKRQADFGDLLRSKGFLWVATSNDTIGGWQQAGNVLRIAPETRWMCLQPHLWDHCDMELVKADMVKEDGTEYEYKDRRQEIVFIGHRMNKDAIQNLLDSCLLTDEEFALGPDNWKKEFAEFDQLNYELPEEDDEEEEDEEDMDESQ